MLLEKPIAATIVRLAIPNGIVMAVQILIGLLEVYFVPRFYYDLELSLLTKSWILVAVGVALLASYATLRPRGRVRS